MKFKIIREALLEPMQAVCGVIERSQTATVLGNVLILADDGKLTLTGTDQEIELVTVAKGADIRESGEVTASAYKLMEICRSLPDGSELNSELSDTRLLAESGKFTSYIATLPAKDFPTVAMDSPDVSLKIAVADMARLLKRVSFAMAQQDVRYFFNGVLMEMDGSKVRLVATNGQRLATSCIETGTDQGQHQFIVPRKAVGELARMLGSDGDAEVTLDFSSNHLRCTRGETRLTTKLIDATYPNYSRAIPEAGGKVLLADRLVLQEALSRTAILSNEIYHNVRLILEPGSLEVHANNPLQEEAEEIVAVEYQGEPLEIGFNVMYLIEALGAMEGGKVSLAFRDANSACRMEDPEEQESVFVTSPMVL